VTPEEAINKYWMDSIKEMGDLVRYYPLESLYTFYTAETIIEALRLIAIKSEIDFQILLNYTAENIVNSELSHEIQKKEIVRYHKLNK
jgi:H2-forming N5,N10-methylenetetrahydromethanopterin dehydrogenase-like enzyme